MTYILPEKEIKKCPECGRSVVSFGEINDGLQFNKRSNKPICAYCSFKYQQREMIKHLQNIMTPAEELTDVPPDILRKFYLRLDELENDLGFKNAAPWPTHISPFGLTGIETENNIAIIYFRYFYQPEFAELGGLNPFRDIILANEILQQFRIAMDYKDIFALWWAHSTIFEFSKDKTAKRRADEYEAVLRKNYEKKWLHNMSQTSYLKVCRILEKRLLHEFLNPDPSYGNKKDQAERLLAFLLNPWQEDFPITEMEKTILAENLTEEFPLKQAMLFYEAWCETGDDRFLKEYLNRFELVMRKGHVVMPYLSNKYAGDVEGLLFSLINEVNNFFKLHDELIWQLDTEDHLEAWEPGEEEYLPPPAVATAFDRGGVLIEDCLTAFLKGTFDNLLTFYLVVSRLLHNTVDKDKRRLLLDKVQGLERSLDSVSSILYRRRLRLKDVEFSRILKALQRMVDSIDILALQEDAQNEMRRLFVMKKAIGSLIVASHEEIERLLISCADKMAVAVTQRCQDPSFSSVEKYLKTEINYKIKYLTDEAWRSLVTAEYLFDIFASDKTKINEEMDYSFISILYYRALEDTLNNTIYTPYVRQLPKNIRVRISRPTDNEKELDPYFSKGSRGFIYRKKDGKWVLINSLTLGTMGHVLCGGVQYNTPKMFGFIRQRVNRGINVRTLLYELGNPLYDNRNKSRLSIAERRNRAAHGGEIISYEDVTIDRGNVYAAVEDAKEYKRLLVMLLNALK